MFVVVKMSNNRKSVSEFSESNFEMTEIRDFKQLVKSASTAAASLPLADLPKAFQLSFALIEKVSGLMLSAFVPSDQNSRGGSKIPNGSISTEPGVSCIDKQCELFSRHSDLEDDEFLNSSFCPGARDNTPEKKTLEKIEAGFSTKVEKPSNFGAKCLDGLETSDCELSEDRHFEKRPHSSHSSVSSSISSTEPQSRCGTFFVDDTEIITTPILDDESVSKRMRCEKLQKSEDRNDTNHCSSNHPTDLAPNSSERRVRDSPEHLSPNHGQSRPSTGREYGSGVCNSADLRRWRLTSTDRLNTLIDECERQINGRKLYVCKFCGKVYEIKSSMRYHMKIIHLQMHLRTTEMQCRICGKQFTCVSAVNRHQSKCMLSTFTDGGIHRSKNYSFSMFGSNRSTGTNEETKSNVCSNAVVVADSVNSYDGRNTVSANESGLVGLRANNTILSAFHNLGVASASLAPDTPEAQYSTTPKGSYSHDSMVLAERNSQTNGNTDCCFAPTCHTRPYTGLSMIPSEVNIDSYWSATGNPIPWPSFPNLNYNLSEMTPGQLEMCMKAVVRGIHTNLTNVNQLNPVPVSESPNNILSKSNTSPCETSADIPGTLDSHRSSFSSTNTNASSETSEAEPVFGVTKSDEVAIDLSARSHADSVMIESF